MPFLQLDIGIWKKKRERLCIFASVLYMYCKPTFIVLARSQGHSDTSDCAEEWRNRVSINCVLCHNGEAFSAFQWGCFSEHLRHSAVIQSGEALKTIGRPLGLTKLIFGDKGGKHTSTITAAKGSFILISERNTLLMYYARRRSTVCYSMFHKCYSDNTWQHIHSNYNFQTINCVVTANGGRGGEIKYVMVYNRTTNRETQSQCLPELCRACWVAWSRSFWLCGSAYLCGCVFM